MMMHKRFRLSGPVLCLTLLFTLCLAGPAPAGNGLYQYSTIDALLAGLYDGDLTVRDLKFHGDFGLGTFNGLDGEMVVLEGQCYHVTAGGKAVTPSDQALTPFAVVTFFEEDVILKLGRIRSLDELNKAVLAALPSRNTFCAIRIDGRFSRIKARAIPRQNPPYQPLAELVKQQVVVKFTGRGTLVGFYSPAFVRGVNVPGFHWHFLTEDRTGGGHVLDAALNNEVARIDELREFSVQLPNSPGFDRLDLSGDRSRELHKVEKDPEGKTAK